MIFIEYILAKGFKMSMNIITIMDIFFTKQNENINSILIYRLPVRLPVNDHVRCSDFANDHIHESFMSPLTNPL